MDAGPSAASMRGAKVDSAQGSGYGLPKLGQIPAPASARESVQSREVTTKREIGPVGRLIDVVA